MGEMNPEPGINTQQYVLDPVGTVSTETGSIVGRLDNLEGATIGLLDNAKTNADVFLEEVGDLLTEKYDVTTVSRRKDGTAMPAESIAAHLHDRCDAVVNAYGDCGSCTSWCIYDSVDLESRGTPVATINSDEFVRLGQSESRSLGIPGLPIATVEHPMGDITESEVRQRARETFDEIVHVLTTDADSLKSEYDNKYLETDEELGDEDLYCPL
ncbi:UGSC family (seleno)protein [Natrinema soli]|uniref:UGSC family (Seleno)protein n=1 Tax=Natrinema soli TaxID=1930624 RepID=A0ABD5SI66_9EURY|nr:UGSC family (seleno)protein [Natrinema soli]